VNLTNACLVIQCIAHCGHNLKRLHEALTALGVPATEFQGIDLEKLMELFPGTGPWTDS
jgi:hypothetical protein